MNQPANKQKMIGIMYIIIVLFSFTSIFSLLAVKTDNQVIKLWKEILVIIFYGLCLCSVFLKKKIKKIAFIFSIVMPLYILFMYFITTLNDNATLVFYQFKSDIIPFLFPFGLYLLIDSQCTAEKIYNKLCKLLIWIGSINVFFIIIQRIFTQWFLVFLDIDGLNNQSGTSGLRLDNTSDGLRAMGTMTSFINSGTLMILSIFILLESGVFNRKQKLMLFPVFLIGAVATTYKTAMLTLIIYIPMKIIVHFVRGGRNKNLIMFLCGIASFCVMSFIFNNSYIYDKLKTTSYEKAAYSSVYLRVLQHADVTKDVYSKNIFTGVGVGVNGTQGPKDIKTQFSSKALDSTYINLLSNYGIIGVFLYITLLVIVFFKLIFWGGLGDILASLIIFFHLGVEFFANNLLMNFPLNIYMSIFVMLALMFKRKSLNGDPQ